MNSLAEDQQNSNLDHLHVPANVGMVEASDPTELELMSAPWEILVKPLSLKTFYTQRNYLITPSTTLYTVSYSSAVHLLGLTPANMLCFNIPLKLGSKSLFWNAPMNQNMLPASLPGGLDVVMDAGQVQIVILIEISLLVQMLTKEQTTALKNAALKRQLPIAKQALDSFTQWLLNLLSHAQHHSDIYQHISVLRSIEEDLLQHLLDLVRLPLQTSAPDSRHKRRQGFELTLEFLREADLSSLSVPEICHTTGVSQRTLEYAFQEHLNITPIGFIRKLRLHAIRRILMSSSSSDISISDTAYRHGINDMGRFASIYKNHFGELPSQTLAKPEIKTVSPFEIYK